MKKASGTLTVTVEVPGPFKVEAVPYTMRIQAGKAPRTKFWRIFVALVVVVAIILAAWKNRVRLGENTK